jgi:hypothetical protein
VVMVSGDGWPTGPTRLTQCSTDSLNRLATTGFLDASEDALT